jgi:hypothetical protein
MTTRKQAFDDTMQFLRSRWEALKLADPATPGWHKWLHDAGIMDFRDEADILSHEVPLPEPREDTSDV